MTSKVTPTKSLEEAAVAPAVAPAEVPASETPSAAPPRRRALAIAGIAAGGVVLAGALFGGGVAVGANLPGDAVPVAGVTQLDEPGGLPEGGPPTGDRPDQPGMQDGQQPTEVTPESN